MFKFGYSYIIRFLLCTTLLFDCCVTFDPNSFSLTLNDEVFRNHRSVIFQRGCVVFAVVMFSCVLWRLLFVGGGAGESSETMILP